MGQKRARILLESVAGSMIEVEQGLIECSYPGRFVTGLMVLVALFWSAGVIAMFVGMLDSGRPQIGLGVLVGLAAVALMLLAVRQRLRTMGRFVVDGRAGELRKVGADGASLATHPLSEVRFELRWDPFHRSFIQRHWVLARCGDVTYRLGKGEHAEASKARTRLEAIRDA